MPRLRRLILITLSALSLLASFTLAIFWMRSYAVDPFTTTLPTDTFRIIRPAGGVWNEVSHARGRIYLLRIANVQIVEANPSVLIPTTQSSPDPIELVPNTDPIEHLALPQSYRYAFSMTQGPFIWNLGDDSHSSLKATFYYSPDAHRRLIGVEWITGHIHPPSYGANLAPPWRARPNPAAANLPPYHVLIIPHWLPTLLFALFPTIHTTRRILHHRRLATRSRAGQCLSCGYDLRSSPTRCPECGATPPAS